MSERRSAENDVPRTTGPAREGIDFPALPPLPVPDLAEGDAPPMRYFIDQREVTEAEAFAAQDAGTAKVAKGGSGVVPEELRQPGETRDQWLRPWLAMRSTPIPPP